MQVSIYYPEVRPFGVDPLGSVHIVAQPSVQYCQFRPSQTPFPIDVPIVAHVSIFTAISFTTAITCYLVPCL